MDLKTCPSAPRPSARTSLAAAFAAVNNRIFRWIRCTGTHHGGGFDEYMVWPVPAFRSRRITLDAAAHVPGVIPAAAITTTIRTMRERHVSQHSEISTPTTRMNSTAISADAIPPWN